MKNMFAYKHLKAQKSSKFWKNMISDYTSYVANYGVQFRQKDIIKPLKYA
jgi:hypothetical protein